MDEYRLQTCLYTNASYYIEEFTSYIKQFEDHLTDHKDRLLSQEHYIFTFNYWINIIDSPYIHIVKADRFMFHSLSYALHNIVKDHPLTLSLKEQFPNNNLCIFFYSYAIALEIQKNLCEFIPEILVKNYISSLNESSFFDQTDEDLNKEHNIDVHMLKKLTLHQLHTNIEIHQGISVILQRCTSFAKEYIQKHPEHHFIHYPS